MQSEEQPATVAPVPTPTARPTETPTATPIPTLAVPQWLPTAVPESTPTTQPTVTPIPQTQPEPTPSPEPARAEELPTVPRYGHYAASLSDGRILIGGGFTGVANNNFIAPFPLNDFQIYDPNDESLLSITPDENQAFFVSTARLSDDKYISVGVGADDERLIGAAEVFDADTQSVTPLPPLNIVRGFPGIAILKDGKVLVIGGVDFSDPEALWPEYLRDVEIFDAEAEAWMQVASMNNEPTENLAVVTLQDGHAMVVHSGVSNAEIYDPAADVWVLTAPMNGIPLMPAAVVLTDGRVLVAGLIPGGFEDYGNSRRYDEDTDTWIPIDPETGEDLESPKIAAAIYDPANDEWTATKSMSGIRMSHTLTLLPDGRVLATGGTSFDISSDEMSEESKPSDQFLVATEIFNPETNEWTPGPEMSEPRYDHTATLLPDGRIFIFGGITIREDIQEIYPTYTSEFITVPDSP
ncbi:MAG: hypothetical protein OXI16_04030 [Chloroflexota bacterium]|nr:hypothetical protein [Chloroflexota bacterium]